MWNALHAMRRFRREKYLRMLVRRGLKLGKNVYLNDGFFLDPAHCFLITIEDGVLFGPCVRLFAHDASSLKIIGKTKVGLIRLKRNCFIGANAVILPDSSVGRNSVLGAGAVLSGHVPDNEIWAGNPARRLMGITEYREKLLAKKQIDFCESRYHISRITSARKREMIVALESHSLGFMKAGSASLPISPKSALLPMAKGAVS